jgi:hypothetical protein
VAEGGALLRRYGGECLHRGFESLLLRFNYPGSRYQRLLDLPWVVAEEPHVASRERPVRRREPNVRAEA